MINPESRVALILGHPGHELRVLNFLETYRPRVYVLTDGSGKDKVSRVGRTQTILTKSGCSMSPVMGKFTDREIYSLMREGNADPLRETMQEILADMIEHDIDFVAGDSIEGFNPTHDLCRYMINGIVKQYEIEK
jgi:hypothetical protein